MTISRNLVTISRYLVILSYHNYPWTANALDTTALASRWKWDTEFLCLNVTTAFSPWPESAKEASVLLFSFHSHIRFWQAIHKSSPNTTIFSGVCLIYTLLLPPDGLITINKYQYKDIRYYFVFLQSYILTWVGVSKGFRPTSWAPSWPLIVKSSFPMQFSVSERPIYYSKMVVKRSGTNSTEYCDCYVFISSKLCL